ncbi:hypothetical protein B296_00013715 [Ensete ventricosum]|uniref:40S ribosomal protein S8 n=1 Tax=Ensete ventricosum TaxID=4639 RepID=A0A427AQ67_ENSVE|nr:hypothetical protein B296_00013715 [Ensete ventricosum]
MCVPGCSCLDVRPEMLLFGGSHEVLHEDVAGVGAPNRGGRRQKYRGGRGRSLPRPVNMGKDRNPRFSIPSGKPEDLLASLLPCLAPMTLPFYSQFCWERFFLDVILACFTICLERYELGRQPANTKLSSNKTVRRVRVRGGNLKWRALRLDHGNYSWGSEAVTRKTRILDVVYNASNNELVRTQTLVKSAIIQVDAAPFKQWYLQHYGVEIGRKKKAPAAKKEATEGQEAEPVTEEANKSNHVTRKLEKRQQGRKLDPHIEEQFSSGRLYIVEGKELEFYMKKIQRKKGKGAGGAA